MQISLLLIPILQGLYGSSQASSKPSGNSVSLINLNWLITLGYSLGALLLIVLVGFIVATILRSKSFKDHMLELWKDRVFLEVSVPRETADEANKTEGKSDTKELTSVGEQVFLLLSEYAAKGVKDWLGRWERVSFEILAIDQKIKFLIVATPKTADVLERVLSSVYPKADIRRRKDIEFFKESSQSFVQELTLANSYELPFRTYRNSEKDPLSTLTNSLINLEKNESAAIQVVIVPLRDTWQKKPREQATKIQQGQSPETVFKGNPGLMKSFGKIGGGLADVGGGLFKEAIKQITNPGGESQKDEQYKNRDIDLTGQKTAIQLTPQQQEIIKKLEEKASRAGFGVTVRVVGSGSSSIRAKQIVETILPAFQIYDINPLNGFKKEKKVDNQSTLNFLIRAPKWRNTMILNTEELCSLWHLPNYNVNNPFIDWLQAKRPSLPLEIPGPGPGNIYIGTARSGMQEKDVYMKTEDRFRHIYALGGSGSGKSVFMTNMVLQDIEAGNGVCVVDPHGETIDDILLRMPESRREDVVIFSPAFIDRPLGLNMLEYDRAKPTQRTQVIDNLFKIWDKLYDLKATGGPMFESYMKNSMRLVMSHEASGSTLMEISKVLSDEEYRTFKLAMCDDQQVVDFWEKEATKAGGEASLENMVPYITSKLAPFITNDFLRPMIGQQKSAINFREAMDNKKIVLVKLEKGLIGESSAYLVGMVTIGNLLMAGMGRNDGFKYNLDGSKTEITASERPPFFIYVDEMQNFLFDAIPQALEEIRKYKVGMVLAHQFVKQVIKGGDERIKDSIMANCASKFIFRAGAEDAEYLQKEFQPTLNAADLQNPERFTANTIMLVDGQKTTPFNIKPKPLSDTKNPELKKQIIEDTKAKYGHPVEEVEKDIKNRVEKFLF
jgi:TraM recognition site of TraD and TraG/Type IV secretory system Conjugative DNA transfer